MTTFLDFKEIELFYFCKKLRRHNIGANRLTKSGSLIKRFRENGLTLKTICLSMKKIILITIKAYFISFNNFTSDTKLTLLALFY